MSDLPLISCENVSKRFCRDLKRSLYYGVRDVVDDFRPWRTDRDENGFPRLRSKEFWANKGVSFELSRGQCLGLIGRNGAGKTTLLKMVSGLMRPDTGSIRIRGRIAALIALGAGFNPVLTARENVQVNGAILGLSRKEIASRMDEIIEFAEVEDFADSPVRSFSSGMKVRLGFSVAAVMLRPDVLLLDEVLAVGDRAFRAKCLVKISEMLENSAVVFVSHQESQIQRICDRVLWLENGQVREEGKTEGVFSRYVSEMDGASEAKSPVVEGNGSLLKVEWSPENKEMPSGSDFTLNCRLKGLREQKIGWLNLILRDEADQVASNSHVAVSGLEVRPGTVLDLRILIRNLSLAAGVYEVNVVFFGKNKKEVVFMGRSLCTFRILSDRLCKALYQPQMEVEVTETGEG